MAKAAKKAPAKKAAKKDDAAPKAAKKAPAKKAPAKKAAKETTAAKPAKAAASGITFKQVMPAVTRAIGDGRGKAFVENPSEESAQAIADVVMTNLMALVPKKKKKA